MQLCLEVVWWQTTRAERIGLLLYRVLLQPVTVQTYSQHGLT